MAKQKQNRPVPAPTQRIKPTPRPPAVDKRVSAIALPAPTSGAILFGFIAAAIGFLLYANSLGNTYCLDDFSAIKDNWVIKGGLKNIGIIFSTEYRYGTWSSPGSLYRPIPLTMFAAEWSLGPDKPFLSHLVNVLLYALTGWALWATWRRILVAYPPLLTAVAVFIFMAHPIHTEVVANIKSRDEIMSLLFATLALYAIWRYLELHNPGWLISAMLAYAVAMFSKEGSIMFIFIFPLVLWFFTNKKADTYLIVGMLMTLPAIAFILVRQQVLGAQAVAEQYSILDNFMVEAKPVDRLASAFMMCWKYLELLFLPHPLVSDKGYPQITAVGFGDWRATVGVVTYFGMGIWAVLHTAKKHFLAFAIWFYLIMFGLISNVPFLIGTSYGERLQYVPSLGFAFAVAWALCKIFKINNLTEIWSRDRGMVAVWSIAGVIALLFAVKTISRNPAWYDSASLYTSDITNSPNCCKLNYHYGLELVKQGYDEKTDRVIDSASIQKGIDRYTHAIDLYPKYHDAYGSRGVAFLRFKKYDQAYEDYQKALEYRPNDARVLSNLGFIYMLQPKDGGTRFDPAKAEEVYRKSVLYDPRFTDARRNLGAVLAMQQKFPQAIEQWKEGLKYEPNSVTLLHFIGSAYKDMGQMENAQPWFDREARAAQMKK